MKQVIVLNLFSNDLLNLSLIIYPNSSNLQLKFSYIVSNKREIKIFKQSGLEKYTKNINY